MSFELVNFPESRVELLAYAAGSLAILATVTAILRVVYNLTLHPLCKFPGPAGAAASEWWEIWHTIKCDRFYVIQALHERLGPVIRIGPNQLSISSPKAFHEVFVAKCNTYLKSDFYATIQPGLGEKYAGLFNYIDHKRALAERRDLQPMFSPSQLRKFEIKYQTRLNELILAMKKEKEVNMFDLFKYLLLDTIGDLALGQSFHQLSSGKEAQYVIDFNNAFMLIGLQNTFSWSIPLIPYLPFRTLKDAYFGLQRVFEYSQSHVKKFLDQDVSEKQSSLMSGYLDTKSGQPKDGYSTWTIALAGHGFIIAGSEASSITLSYALWLLIKNPAIEKRLREEIETLPENYTYIEVAKLLYLDAVIREVLRVYPPAPSPMPRMTPNQAVKIDGVEYPKRTIISAQPYTLHRNTEAFPQPEVFDPDRWLNATAEEKEVMNKCFIPFSAGQRGCIGRGLAWMHMELALVRVLREFKSFKLSDEMTDDDMVLIERGALAKPKSTKLIVSCVPADKKIRS